jgi:hypothetical protein
MAIEGGYKVKWKGTQLGDHAYVAFSYNSNHDTRIIPRAKGVKIWSTEELGGGYLSITVHAVVARDNRYTLESYFSGLDSTFELNAEGDLVILDRYGNTYTLTDCYLTRFTQESSDLKINTFTLDFVKSL